MTTKRPTEAFRSERLFEDGIGYVIVARFKGNSDAEVGCFLLDVWCLGVKDAFFDRWSAGEYEPHLARVFGEHAKQALEPCCARKLVEQAVAYASQLGFGPHRDYKAACRVFGGISTADCSETFEFGKDGKPFFISGPNESGDRARRIVHMLHAKCGAGNYNYLAATDEVGEPFPQQSRVLSREEINVTKEADYIIDRAQAREGRIVTLGGLVLFSTDTGDAWMLDPGDGLALCLARGGERQRFSIDEDGDRYCIAWTSRYRIEGNAFHVVTEGRDARTIHGYPTEPILSASASGTPRGPRPKPGFAPISVADYVKLHLESNPDEDPVELTEALRSAVAAAKQGERCSCGNPIWAVGSAQAGHGCFPCITGEPYPESDYEIDEVCHLHENAKPL